MLKADVVFSPCEMDPINEFEMCFCSVLKQGDFELHPDSVRLSSRRSLSGYEFRRVDEAEGVKSQDLESQDIGM